MSKFDLRDISERLTGSTDTETVVYEFIGYLQSVQPDWQAALAFYEVSQDSLVNVYERQGNRLNRRDMKVPVDHLPARLVRKFFHPSAFFNQSKPRAMLSQWLRSSPSYEPDPVEAPALRPVVPVANWRSCVCMPLVDRDDVLALLVIASEKKGAFTSKAIDDLVPIKNVAAMALSQHLHRAGAILNGQQDVRTTRQNVAEFQDRLRQLNAHTQELEEENRAKAEKLAALGRDLELLEKDSSGYRHELERVKDSMLALEEQSVAATHHLSEAYTELNLAHSRLTEMDRTVEFMKDVFQVLAKEHDPTEFTTTMVSWLCERFAVERCSLMLLDHTGDTLQITAQCGIDRAIAERVKVRVGQGVAGWVAHNRKPLFVRVNDEAPGVPRMVQETYNSDSFICVPLIYNDRLFGVLNLSNKRDGEPFESLDLDRAMMAGAVLAITLGGHEVARRVEECA